MPHPAPADPTDAVRTVLGDHVRGLDHVGIATADLEAALVLWTRTLGLALGHREVNQDQGVAEAMLEAGDRSAGASATRVQLVAPLRPDTALARSIDRRGEGLHHVALLVDDVVAAAATLRAAGLRLLYDDPRPGTAGSKINFVHPGDGRGVLVELVEPAATDPRGLSGSALGAG